jgi:16S rRNA (guanine527-N7)-methyltransferase
MPLKLARPELVITLVEPSRKKATFLLHMVRCLELPAVRVVQARAEALAADPREAAAYDVGLARAVAAPTEAARLVRPLMRPGGVFLLQLGADPPPPGAWDRLLALGFEIVRDQAPPPALGRSGRVVALRRLG